MQVTRRAPVSSRINDCPLFTVFFMLACWIVSHRKQEPGSLFPLGEHVVTYTASDAAGNSARCQFTVSVSRESPLLVLPSPALSAGVAS